MTYPYQGHYIYHKAFVLLHAPNEKGIYYCGYTNAQNILETLYVGRAIGEGVTIRSRLLDHLIGDNWPDVTHFGFRTSSSKEETTQLELLEIQRLNPKYNSVGRLFF